MTQAFIQLDPGSHTPIYEQIVSQITFHIASGALEVGTRIPSVRELRDQLVVNPNTVARAFQELERRGILVARRGLGMEVTAEAPRLCRQQRAQHVRDRIREALREAVSSALPAEEIRQLVDEELAHVNGQRRTRE
jgi:GntR family transcriptional regulator